MKILLTGGGTAGSVSPLLAIREQMDKLSPGNEYLWIGTPDGPERVMVEKAGITFEAVPSGKLRRYFSWRNFVDPFKVLLGIRAAKKIIKKFNPSVILSAGGFVCVPVIIAGARMKKLCFVHQQDLRLGLANKFMTRYASKITVAFEQSLKDFPKDKVHLMGNPVRAELLAGNKERAVTSFKLEAGLPTLLIIGGSLGSEFMNNLIFSSVPELIAFCQIIHLTGRGGVREWANRAEFGEKATRYHQYEFMFDELADAMEVADLVVARAGLSTLSELAALGKASIIIPIPDNQQEDNVKFFTAKNGIVALDQRSLQSREFIDTVRNLLENPSSLTRLGHNISRILPADAAEKYAKFVVETVQSVG